MVCIPSICVKTLTCFQPEIDGYKKQFLQILETLEIKLSLLDNFEIKL